MERLKQKVASSSSKVIAASLQLAAAATSQQQQQHHHHQQQYPNQSPSQSQQQQASASLSSMQQQIRHKYFATQQQQQQQQAEDNQARRSSNLSISVSSTTNNEQVAHATAHLTAEERNILEQVFKKEQQFERDTRRLIIAANSGRTGERTQATPPLSERRQHRAASVAVALWRRASSSARPAPSSTLATGGTSKDSSPRRLSSQLQSVLTRPQAHQQQQPTGSENQRPASTTDSGLASSCSPTKSCSLSGTPIECGISTTTMTTTTDKTKLKSNEKEEKCRSCRKKIDFCGKEKIRICNACKSYICEDCASYLSEQTNANWLCSSCRRRNTQISLQIDTNNNNNLKLLSQQQNKTNLQQMKQQNIQNYLHNNNNNIINEDRRNTENKNENKSSIANHPHAQRTFSGPPTSRGVVGNAQSGQVKSSRPSSQLNTNQSNFNSRVRRQSQSQQQQQANSSRPPNTPIATPSQIATNTNASCGQQMISNLNSQAMSQKNARLGIDSQRMQLNDKSNNKLLHLRRLSDQSGRKIQIATNPISYNYPTHAGNTFGQQLQPDLQQLQRNRSQSSIETTGNLINFYSHFNQDISSSQVNQTNQGRRDSHRNINRRRSSEELSSSSCCSSSAADASPPPLRKYVESEENWRPIAPRQVHSALGGTNSSCGTLQVNHMSTSNLQRQIPSVSVSEVFVGQHNYAADRRLPQLFQPRLSPQHNINELLRRRSVQLESANHPAQQVGLIGNGGRRASSGRILPRPPHEQQQQQTRQYIPHADNSRQSSASCLELSHREGVSQAAMQQMLPENQLRQQLLNLPAGTLRRASAPEGQNIKIIVDDIDFAGSQSLSSSRLPTDRKQLLSSCGTLQDPNTESMYSACGGSYTRSGRGKAASQMCERLVLYADDVNCKHDEPFGLRVIGGKIDPRNPQRVYAHVSHVTKGGPAEKMGVKKGDLVLEWDGTSLSGLSFEQVAEIIDASANIAELVIRPKSVSRTSLADRASGMSGGVVAGGVSSASQCIVRAPNRRASIQATNMYTLVPNKRHLPQIPNIAAPVASSGNTQNNNTPFGSIQSGRKSSNVDERVKVIMSNKSAYNNGDNRIDTSGFVQLRNKETRVGVSGEENNKNEENNQQTQSANELRIFDNNNNNNNNNFVSKKFEVENEKKKTNFVRKLSSSCEDSNKICKQTTKYEVTTKKEDKNNDNDDDDDDICGYISMQVNFDELRKQVEIFVGKVLQLNAKVLFKSTKLNNEAFCDGYFVKVTLLMPHSKIGDKFKSCVSNLSKDFHWMETFIFQELQFSNISICDIQVEVAIWQLISSTNSSFLLCKSVANFNDCQTEFWPLHAPSARRESLTGILGVHLQTAGSNNSQPSAGKQRPRSASNRNLPSPSVFVGSSQQFTRFPASGSAHLQPRRASDELFLGNRRSRNNLSTSSNCHGIASSNLSPAHCGRRRAVSAINVYAAGGVASPSSASSRRTSRGNSRTCLSKELCEARGSISVCQKRIQASPICPAEDSVFPADQKNAGQKNFEHKMNSNNDEPHDYHQQQQQQIESERNCKIEKFPLNSGADKSSEPRPRVQDKSVNKKRRASVESKCSALIKASLLSSSSSSSFANSVSTTNKNKIARKSSFARNTFRKLKRTISLTKSPCQQQSQKKILATSSVDSSSVRCDDKSSIIDGTVVCYDDSGVPSKLRKRQDIVGKLTIIVCVSKGQLEFTSIECQDLEIDSKCPGIYLKMSLRPQKSTLTHTKKSFNDNNNNNYVICKRKTKVAPPSSNPIFDCSKLRFDASLVDNKYLEISLWNKKSKLRSKVCLGFTNIKLNELCLSSEKKVHKFNLHSGCPIGERKLNLFASNQSSED